MKVSLIGVKIVLVKMVVHVGKVELIFSVAVFRGTKVSFVMLRGLHVLKHWQSPAEAVSAKTVELALISKLISKSYNPATAHQGIQAATAKLTSTIVLVDLVKMVLTASMGLQTTLATVCEALLVETAT